MDLDTLKVMTAKDASTAIRQAESDILVLKAYRFCLEEKEALRGMTSDGAFCALRSAYPMGQELTLTIMRLAGIY